MVGGWTYSFSNFVLQKGIFKLKLVADGASMLASPSLSTHFSAVGTYVYKSSSLVSFLHWNITKQLKIYTLTLKGKCQNLYIVQKKNNAVSDNYYAASHR